MAWASSRLWSVMVIICCRMSPMSCFPRPPGTPPLPPPGSPAPGGSPGPPGSPPTSPRLPRPPPGGGGPSSRSSIAGGGPEAPSLLAPPPAGDFPPKLAGAAAPSAPTPPGNPPPGSLRGFTPALNGRPGVPLGHPHRRPRPPAAEKMEPEREREGERGGPSGGVCARGGRREQGERGRRLGEGSGRKRRGGEEERGGAGGGETQAGRRRRVEAGSDQATWEIRARPRDWPCWRGAWGVGHLGSEPTVWVVQTPAAGMFSDSSVHISCSNDSPPCST